MRSLLPSAAHSFCNALVPFRCILWNSRSCCPVERPINLKVQRGGDRCNKPPERRKPPLLRSPLRVLSMQELTFQNSRPSLNATLFSYPSHNVVCRDIEKTSEIRYTNWNFVLDRACEILCCREKYFSITKIRKLFYHFKTPLSR